MSTGTGAGTAGPTSRFLLTWFGGERRADRSVEAFEPTFGTVRRDWPDGDGEGICPQAPDLVELGEQAQQGFLVDGTWLAAVATTAGVPRITNLDPELVAPPVPVPGVEETSAGRWHFAIGAAPIGTDRCRSAPTAAGSASTATAWTPSRRRTCANRSARSRVAVLCCREASLWTWCSAAKSRTLGLYERPIRSAS